MIKRNNLYFGSKPYEKALVTNNQALAQTIGNELIKYKTVFDDGSSATEWLGIAKFLGYPTTGVFNTSTGRLQKSFNDVIRALQQLAVTGEHRHPVYHVYYLHNKEIIGQN